MCAKGYNKVARTCDVFKGSAMEKAKAPKLSTRPGLKTINCLAFALEGRENYHGSEFKNACQHIQTEYLMRASLFIDALLSVLPLAVGSSCVCPQPSSPILPTSSPASLFNSSRFLRPSPACLRASVGFFMSSCVILWAVCVLLVALLLSAVDKLERRSVGDDTGAEFADWWRYQQRLTTSWRT